MKFVYAMIISAGMLLLAAPGVSQAAPAAPEQTLEFKGSKQSVPFSHKSHAAIDCKVCHHDVNGQESYAKCGSAGCHDDLVGKKGVKSLYYVVHNRKELAHQTCMSCHVKEATAKPDQKKALTGCKGSLCHS